MIYAFLILAIISIFYGPQIWVKYVLKKNSGELPQLNGTGGELAVHLLKRFKLEEVKVEASGPGQDHYDPENNAVRLSPEYLNGKSLTAVAVAAHEVGHAIQFNRKEPVSHLREHYLGHAIVIRKAGTIILMLSPVVFAIFPVPHAFLITALVGLMTMLTSVAMYMAILPEEWDASFNKALPILVDGDYVNENQIKAVRSVLRACALTYVAAALSDILSLWRWLLILRR